MSNLVEFALELDVGVQQPRQLHGYVQTQTGSACLSRPVILGTEKLIKDPLLIAFADPDAGVTR